MDLIETNREFLKHLGIDVQDSISDLSEREEDRFCAKQNMSRVKKVIHNLYADPYNWSIVKSIGVFLLGVKIALECKGLELMGPPVPM